MAAIALPAVLASTLGAGEPGGTGVVRGTIWVANEGADTLTAIDAETHAVVTVLRGIPAPHNVQVSPDGRTVWATSSAGFVAAIDADTHAVLGAVETGASPAHVVLTPDGGTAAVTNTGDDTLALIDARTLRLERHVPTGAGPHGLRPSPQGDTVLVAHMGADTVGTYDLERGRATGTIQVGPGPVQVAYAPDGRYAYASVNGNDSVVKIDLAAGRVVASAPVGDGPVQVALTPDGGLLVVASQGAEEAPSDVVTLVSTPAMTVVGEARTGAGAHGVAVEPGGRQAFVTDVWAGDVAVLDLATGSVVDRIDVGGAPNGISFSPLRQAGAAMAVEQGAPHEMVLPLGGRTDGGGAGGAPVHQH